MTITAAAVIVGCSRQTGSKWVEPARRGQGLEDRSSRPHRSPRRVADTVEQAVLKARVGARGGPARDRLGDRRAGVDRPRDPAPARLLTANAAVYRGARSSATSATGPASWCTWTQRSSAGSSDLDIASPATAPTSSGCTPAGSTCLSPSTTPPARLRPALPGRDNRLGDQLPGCLPALLPPARHHDRARPHRQWHLLQTRWHDACQQHITAKTDAALPAADQRQSRTLHPHPARALGVRHALPHRTRPRQRPTRRHRHLQSQPTTPRPRRADTASARQRPIWDEHLGQVSTAAWTAADPACTADRSSCAAEPGSSSRC